MSRAKGSETVSYMVTGTGVLQAWDRASGTALRQEHTRRAP